MGNDPVCVHALPSSLHVACVHAAGGPRAHVGEGDSEAGYVEIPVCGNLRTGTEKRSHQKVFMEHSIVTAALGQYRSDSFSAFLAWPHRLIKLEVVRTLDALCPKHLLTKAALWVGRKEVG